MDLQGTSHGFVGKPNDFNGIGKKRLPCLRKGHSLAIAVEQLDAKAMLQKIDLLNQGRWGNVELSGSFAEASCAGDLNEGLDLPRIHQVILSLGYNLKTL